MSDCSVLMDAMGYVDDRYIRRYLSAKNGRNRRKSVIRWSAAAACFVCLIAVLSVSIHFGGYHQGLDSDEWFNRTHTYFDTFDELISLIGEDTLLSNINMDEVSLSGIMVTHALDSVESYSIVCVEVDQQEGHFAVTVYFPTAPEKDRVYCSGETITVNGVEIQFADRSAGSQYTYYYSAEWELGECKYVVNCYGNANDDFFETMMNDLIKSE